MSNGLNISLKSYDSIFQSEEQRNTEEIKPVPISELKPFTEQPFKVKLDEDMDALVESIKQCGVLTPVIARPHKDGGYEILSGHRRVKACELAGITDIPVVIKNLDDDTATILLVDSNLQREHILPSEKAFAYQMKLEAMKRQGARVDLTSAQIGRKFRPLTKLKSAVKFFVKNLFKLREIWYNVGIENSVIMGCRNAFGRNKPTNKNGVCMYRGFGTERPYFKKDR